MKRKFPGRSEKFYEVPVEVSIPSFILNFEVCNQSFEVRVGSRLNRFDYKNVLKFLGTCLQLLPSGEFSNKETGFKYNSKN